MPTASSIGLGVSNTTEGMQSNIILLADRTSIMTNAGGTPTLIFTTQGTQAILNSVVIGDATITAAKIADAAITSAKIASAQIKTAHITDGAITNAKISGIIQSSTFSEVNKTGWKLNKEGDGIFYGTIYADRIEGDIFRTQPFNAFTSYSDMIQNPNADGAVSFKLPIVAINDRWSTILEIEPASYDRLFNFVGMFLHVSGFDKGSGSNGLC